MGKIKLIIAREYLTRVRKKSFIIMTLVGPMVMAALLLTPIMIQKKQASADFVYIYDSNDQLQGINDVGGIKFVYVDENTPVDDFLKNKGVNASLLIVPEILDKNLPTGFQLISNQENDALLSIVKLVVTEKLMTANAQAIKPQIVMSIEKQTDKSGGQVFSYAGAVLIYFFIFLYGVQVMKGVIEEKSNRIIEVVASSVKPFQLMLGKIFGLALVGLTQYVIWLIVVGGIYTFVLPSTSEVALENINLPLIVGVFFIYFIFGYLIYGAMFAAIGAASDADTDTQQFILPITVPLLFSFLMVDTIIQDPNSTFAIALSEFPLTSPIVMMTRLPLVIIDSSFILQLLGSIVGLILGFLFVTWLAGRIYKVGILTYGQKVGYKELFKWMRVK